jgi:hypothetical protein
LQDNILKPARKAGNRSCAVAKATPVGNVSLSDAYKAKLKFIVDNAPGARSSASFMRGAVESAIDAKLAELLPK